MEPYKLSCARVAQPESPRADEATTDGSRLVAAGTMGAEEVDLGPSLPELPGPGTSDLGTVAYEVPTTPSTGAPAGAGG